jgi:flagellin
MIINTNVSSLTAQEAAKNTNSTLSSSLEKLSTGLKINKASDDASGLAIADKLRTQASSLKQGISNANSASALIQIADKAMAEQSSILDTVKSKLIQASTDTTSTDGRAAINADIKKLLTQLDDIATQTNYNGTNLLNSAKTLNFQVGEESGYDITAVTTKASNTTELGGSSVAGTANADVAAGSSNTYKETADNTEMVFTLAGNAENIGTTFVGAMDSLAVNVAANVTFTANDDATKAALDAAVGAGLMTSTASGGTYSLAADATAVNFGGQTLSLTVNGVGAATDTVTIGSSSTVTVTNSDNDTAITTTGTTTADTLASVKNASSLSNEDANNFMAIIDRSLTQLNENRSVFGSTQNQLESAVRNMSTTQTNILAAESIIRDVDYAEESANFNKQNIISQAGSYAISQANTVQQNVLKLLQ